MISTQRVPGYSMVFIDLEKAFDKIPKQEVWSCLNGRGVPEKYMNLVP